MTSNNYSRLIVTKPDYEAGPDFPVTGRKIPTMTLMSNNLVAGSNNYIEAGWIWDMPEPNPHIFEHVHKYNEIVLHIGSDYQNPEDLGAEIEYVVGGEPYLLKTTSAVFIPAGVKHGPLTWKNVRRPHIEMTIMLGCGNVKDGWQQ